MGWFETHAHLADSQFDPDRLEVLERANRAHVLRFIEIADGPQEWGQAQFLAEQNVHQMWWAGGIHPYYADQISDQTLSQLEIHSRHPQFVAIGEIGLDYAKCPIPAHDQKNGLRRLLDMAQPLRKTLVLHCRNAYPDLIDILSAYFKSRPHFESHPGVMHCFSGQIEEAQKLVEMGFYIGVDAPITYPNAHSLRQAIAGVPIERLVIETDSPYLPPQTFRGKRNEPSYIPMIAAKLAEIKGIELAELETILWQNSCRLFHIE